MQRTWAYGIALFFVSFIFSFHSSTAHAWGRHDLITTFAVETLQQNVQVKAEPIESAAPDLLARVIPLINSWNEGYSHEHDSRYQWSTPKQDSTAFGRKLNAREALLWALEDNIKAPLDFSVTASDDEHAERRRLFGAPGLLDHGLATNILINYVEEPDAMIDSGFDQAPYLDRLRDSMSLFYEGTAHTHTFRHYYVPTSLLPPLTSPRGVAPYRSALYAELAIAAFRTHHRYWGYRFLAWSIHYAQDATQPWHTVFLPSLSFLSISKERMRHSVAGFHYLTEALSDSWLKRTGHVTAINPHLNERGPWVVAQWVEEAARNAHEQAAKVASVARPIFEPILKQLDSKFTPKANEMRFGQVLFPLAKLDFSGNGEGATEFFTPIWSPEFPMAKERDELIGQISQSISSAVALSRMIMFHVLREGGEMKASPQFQPRVPALQSNPTKPSPANFSPPERKDAEAPKQTFWRAKDNDLKIFQAS